MCLQEDFKIFTILAKVEMLDKSTADERLIIRRRLVLFWVFIPRLAEESLRLIFVKQPAQA